MANEKVNKVILGNETLIDLTGDTVSANNLLSGATAHDASGEQIQGNVTVPDVLDDLSDVNASSPASGDVLFRDGTEWINKKITIEVTQAEYNALEAQGLVDPDVRYRIKDGILTCAPVDDNDVSEQKTWSSQKIYDTNFMNRPDLWTVGTEYDFGEGLYGQRYTGTLSVTTTATAYSIDDNFDGTHFICCGGDVYFSSFGVSLQFPFSDPGTYLQLQINSGLKITAKAYNNSSFPYDIWVLYTKAT